MRVGGAAMCWSKQRLQERLWLFCFVKFIAGNQQEWLVADLIRSKFFKLQADGSTDAGNIEDELFFVLYMD